jgi:phosphate-selective porin OprO/OprP
MSKRNVFTTVALAALASTAGVGAAYGQAATTTTQWNGAPETREGEMRFKMRGRFQYDILSSDFDVGTDDGTRSYVRRAFLGATGRLSEHWRYKIDFILAPGANDISNTSVNLCRNTTTNVVTSSSAACGAGTVLITTVPTGSGGGEDVGVDDAYLEYAGDFFSLVIGEHNVTVPLEDRTSSLDTPFNERSSLINAFGYGRAAGIGFVTTGAGWSAALAVQGDSVNNQDSGFVNDELVQYSGRFTWAPLFETSPEGVTLIHLGAHARYRYIGDDAGIRYRNRPLLGRGARPLDFGSGTLGERDTALGVEAAVQFNSFGATVEYAQLDGEESGPAGGSEFDFTAYYADVFWSPTGEPRNYRANTGSWGAVSPRRPVNQGGIGHIMLGARYDFVELSGAAGGSLRGEQSGWGVGADWVPIDHVKFKLNYAISEIDLVTGADEEAQVVSFRTQFDF